MISICMTFKNRANFLKTKFENLLWQNFNPKEIEICITDGYSDDNLLEILNTYKDKFFQIKYALADRNKLPFKIESNCPACDRNALVSNLPSFEKCIITDAEVMFTDKEALNRANIILEDKEKVIAYKTYFVKEEKYNKDFLNSWETNGISDKFTPYHNWSGLCIGINKSTFIKNRGFEELFSKGFSGEDDFFFQWYSKKGFVVFDSRRIIHLWHSSQWSKRNKELRENYTLPLLLYLQNNNVFPNKDNLDWQRKEMLSDIQIFKGDVLK